MNRADQLELQAVIFHNDNPEVFELFETLTFSRIRKGFKHYSAKAVWERIRWELDAPYAEYFPDYDFKLNNNYHAIFARWFMAKHPEHEGFFRTRARPSELAPPWKGNELSPQDYQ